MITPSILLAMAGFAAVQDAPPTSSVGPERSASATPGFVDLARAEAGVRVGVALFSDEFETDPAGCGGLFLRAPMPGVATLLGFGEFGITIQGGFSSVDRDFEPAVEDPSGSILYVGAGVDLSLLRSGGFEARAQAGMQYLTFGGVTELEDGAAMTVGAWFGIELFEGIGLSYAPEFSFSGADWILFNPIGVGIRF